MIIEISEIAKYISKVPKFIVIDGVNGAGKTSVQNALAQFLESKGHTVLKTREPGGSVLGLKLREILLSGDLSSKPTPMSEVFMFSADRAEHVAHTIRPALAAGKFVISDRYFYSTTAFQGYARGLDLNAIEQINTIAINGLLPDLVLILDLDPQKGLQRNKAETKQDRLELENLEYHQKVRQGFLTIAKDRPETFIIIDASKSKEAVTEECLAIFSKFH